MCRKIWVKKVNNIQEIIVIIWWLKFCIPRTRFKVQTLTIIIMISSVIRTLSKFLYQQVTNVLIFPPLTDIMTHFNLFPQQLLIHSKFYSILIITHLFIHMQITIKICCKIPSDLKISQEVIFLHSWTSSSLPIFIFSS